jgi:serine/threonine protein kinase
MVGQKILYYQLIEKIGAGGMGEIYKAQDTRLNRMVAVKVLSPGLSTDPERRRRFFQEAQAASALNHPNIITLYDIVAEGDLHCIVMEFIGGKTLRDLTPAGGLPAPQALQYAAQIASALTAAHAAGIIHRDLKPSNIMVNTSGLIKVLDFGLAKWVDPSMSGQSGEQTTVEAALTREGSIIGTVSYMSPEQAEGKRVDARSDIFSFGSVLYEMVTGKRAFEGRSGISTLSAILRDDVKPIYESAPEVPPLLEQIILRCLPKEPAARWQSMKEIEGALITLQRQLDPEGHFAPPVPTSSIPVIPVPPPAPAAVSVTPAAVVAAAPTAMEAERVPAPEPAAPLNGPTKAGPSKAGPPTKGGPPTKAGPPQAPASARVDEPSPGSPSPAGNVRPVAASPAAGPAAARAPGTSPKALVVILGLIGAVLVAGAGIGGWWWWKGQPSTATPAPTQTTVSVAKPSPIAPPAATSPAPVQPQPAAPEAPNAAASAAPPAAPTTAPDEAKSAKPKKTPKPKADKTAKVIPPPPPPVAPAPPVPEPDAAVPAPPPPKPTPRPPVIQTTPVTVSDALPFAINLTEDVPAEATEGQALHFTVAEGLQVGEKTVIAKGAAVTGAVTGETGKKKCLGIGGGRKLTFRLIQAEAVDGRKVAVRAVAGKSPEGPTIRSFDTGKSSKSKGYAALQGTTYVAYIDGDQMVAVRQ